MAICEHCGGDGWREYASPQDRMEKYGMPRGKDGLVYVPLGTSVWGECCVCWGTGDRDHPQAHPFSRNVIIEDQEFRRNPFLSPNPPKKELAVLFEIHLQGQPTTMIEVMEAFRATLKEVESRTVSADSCRVHWANLRGYAEKAIRDEQAPIPFWASHAYVEIYPPSTTYGPKGGLRLSLPPSYPLHQITPPPA
jgi:hypothetical protein